MDATPPDELERQLRHASFFVQASLEQQGRLLGKLDAYVTALLDALLDAGVVDVERLADAVDANRAEQAEETRSRYEADGALPAWPAVVVREETTPEPGEEPPPAAEVEVDCASRLAVCQAVCCTLPFPLSAAEVEAGDVRWDLGHPYVIRQNAEGYCVHNRSDHSGCTVYDRRPGVCRGYSCANDDRIWLDFDNMVLNEEFLAKRRRPDYTFHPTTTAVPVTISARPAAGAPA
jgi:Fe-S-cluster containining protein